MPIKFPDGDFRWGQLIFWFTMLFILFLVVGLTFASKDAENGNYGELRPSLPMIQSNSIVAITAPYHIEPKTYGMIIDCLEEKESQFNPDAFNPCDVDGRPKYGCLQFDSRTFESFCVQRYNYRDDIWDCEIQRECADDMIRDGFGFHWGTWTRCNY